MKIGGFRAALATLFSLALIVSTGLPAQAQDAWRAGDPSFFTPRFGSIPVNYQDNTDIILIEEEAERTYDAVFHRTSGNPVKFTLCEDPGQDLNCGQPPGGNLWGTVVLPFCTDAVENCIEGMSVGTSSSMEVATYAGTGYGFPFKGDPSKGIPNGSGPSFFDAKHAHSNGNRYVVAALMSFGVVDGRLNVEEFSVRVFPVDPRQSSLTLPKASVCDAPTGQGFTPCIEHREECSYQIEGICAAPQNFSPNTRIKVDLKLSNQVSGWFRGRLQNPEILVDPINPLYSRVQVSGAPVEVPRAVVTYVSGQDGPDIVRSGPIRGFTGPFTLFDAASARGVEIVNGIRGVTKDTATAVNSLWMINSITGNSASQGQGSSCLADQSRLLGLVTTNAMSYTGTVPDYKSGYLSYRVAGMHFLPDGVTEAIGTYDLVMRSDVARCLYGFTKAPVSATIQVVGAGGEETVATTIVSERDGWLKLAAYGFTFSEKEIRVTLDQVKVAVPKTLNLTRFTGKTTQLRLEQRWAIEDFVKASENTKSLTCTAMFVSPSDRARALTRARVACNAAKLWNSDYVLTTAVKQTKTKSLDGRVVMSSK